MKKVEMNIEFLAECVNMSAQNLYNDEGDLDIAFFLRDNLLDPSNSSKSAVTEIKKVAKVHLHRDIGDPKEEKEIYNEFIK